MTSPFGWSELIAAAIGAFATGFFGIWDRRGERRHKRQATLASFRAQSVFLCELIRSQSYHTDARAVAEESKKDDWDGSLLIIDASQNYLDIFECLRGDFGLLDEAHVTKIIEFYNRAKVFIDSTKPGGAFLKSASVDAKRSHAVETHLNVERLLLLGEEIAQLGEPR